MGELSPELVHQLSKDGSSIFDFEAFSKTTLKKTGVIRCDKTGVVEFKNKQGRTKYFRLCYQT